jgi:aldose 1-epimerase
LWDIEKIGPQQVILKTISADGDMGYPGDLTVQVKFSLDNNNNLRIDYQANTNKKTPINLTNHSYFNLSGDFQNQINNHELILNSIQYTPIDSEFIPIGELRYVSDTPFDFTKSTIIGKQIIHTPSGFDHNFVLDKEIEHEMYNDLYRAATLTDLISGRQLQIYTTEPGIQFYTGNFLNGTLTTENGQPINKHTALCLETQHFPNSPNEPLFPNTILDPGTIFRSSTIYSFKVISKQF